MERGGHRDRIDALTRARHRVVGALPGSPEWDAALAEVEAIERVLDDDAASQEPIAVPADEAHAVLHVGPHGFNDHATVRGTLTGRRSAAETLHGLAADLADRTPSAREYLRELERLASGRGFVLEVAPSPGGDVIFYGWFDETSAAAVDARLR